MTTTASRIDLPAGTAAALYSALTPRECQVLHEIGQGLTNKEIGARLGIAEKTVKNTVTVILSKLGLQRRAQAAVHVAVAEATGGRVTHFG
ncbi:response regulator transcription factor [Nakamurella aerolata]|uniref:Response regulator transcription factor n=1 Tax=Nakamurella aerolata TaxID=1656892 RepID=A0A849ADE8_9ACTN|nr:LuxR C-terminal-related transcriptional regulator [Nakamurella aerolata]NNG37231.1 response regulator transcription factor [Nakamurella aerolata]